ncbi:MarR family winged helix-turn-helix transcriptional regulator [Pseudoclavibacter terrae]|uniref:MarR family winged helix-turn-helix transcriptional regulator n=1 Tax=Pseudoclavibacter terrae TaxID=1530195 RepID=UPI00232D6528|nr:MarR family winged helix-turn-helix transcriptional regulator [Pseudoclavibacter terrae]
MSEDESSETDASQSEALFSFVRFWSRRWGQIPRRTSAAHNQNVLVVQAVVSLTREAEPTIQDLATELGCSHAHASRAAARAATDGYVDVRKSTFDGRFKHLKATALGLRILVEALSWQEAVYRALTNDWTSRERQEFERLSARLAAKSVEYEALWPMAGEQILRANAVDV